MVGRHYARNPGGSQMQDHVKRLLHAVRTGVPEHEQSGDRADAEHLYGASLHVRLEGGIAPHISLQPVFDGP